MKMWRQSIAAAGLLALVVGVVTLPAVPVIHMVPPTIACVVGGVMLAAWPGSRRFVPGASLLVGAVSLLATAVVWVSGGLGPEPQVPTNLWMMLEPAALTVFVYLPVRWSPPRQAVLAGGTVALAVALIVQRYLVLEPWLETLAGSIIWLLPSMAAGTIGWYLRSLSTARARDIADAQREQRLELAGDLHDFVAHDVSEIVAQAQAGRMVLASRHPSVAQVLERIETAGLRALASMDRTVDMLRDSTRSPVGGLDDLSALVSRFEAVGSAATGLTLSGPLERVPREMAAVAYRVVVEALTNVRRHAATATRVTVSVEVTDEELAVAVTDNGYGTNRPLNRQTAGLGLPGLTARVAALDGTLAAAPHPPYGWRLSARFPLPGKDRKGTP